MEILVIFLVCAWALYMMIGHFTKHFRKNSSCCDNCDKCSEHSSCTEKMKKA